MKRSHFNLRRRRLLLGAIGLRLDLMRSLSATTFGLGGLLFTRQAEAAGLTTIVRNLVDYFEDVDAWADWFSRAIPRAREGLPPDAPPSDSMLTGRMTQVIDAMTRLAGDIPTAMPTPLAPMPSLSSQPDALRNALSAHQARLDAALDEYAELRDGLREIRSLHQAAARRLTGLARTGNALVGVLSRIGDGNLNRLVGYDVLDLVPPMGATYAAAKRLEEILSERYAANREVLERRRLGLADGYAQLAVALSLEAAALRGAADALREKETALKARGEDLQALRDLQAQRRAELQLIQAEIEREQTTVRDRTREVERNLSLIQETDAAIASLKPKVELGYAGYAGPDACPNGAIYARCNHVDRKRAFANNLSRWTSALADARASRTRARRLRDEAMQARTAAEQGLSRRRPREQALNAETDARRVEIERTTTELAREAQTLMEEMYRSRATQHADANAAAAQRVRDVAGRLNAPLPQH